MKEKEGRQLYLGELLRGKKGFLFFLTEKVVCMKINDLNFQTCKESQKWEFKVKQP